jgi:orotidine-5'-phosphate decarboxylase
MTDGASPLIAALDTADLTQAADWAARLAPHCAFLKLGLEFFCAQGPAGLGLIRHRLFLDLKLHDIPATVAGAIRALAPVGAGLLTVHAAGGAAMIAAARAAVEAQGETLGGARPLLLAVTVLTSIDSAQLANTGVAGGTRQQVLRLARVALSAGADGLVCSGHEVAMLRDAFGAGPVLVVPGIRPAGAALDDQARVMAPAAAMAAGATYLVVGRPVTGAADPAAAALALLAELG